MPLLVRSGFFLFFICLGNGFIGVFSAPIPEEEILDYLAHGPFIRVFTVHYSLIEVERERKKRNQSIEVLSYYYGWAS